MKYNLLIIFLVIILLFSMWNNIVLKKQVSADILNAHQVTESNGYLKEDINTILKNEYSQLKTEDTKLNPNIMLINKENETVCLKDIVGNGKIIIYYGDTYCNVCYEMILSYINKHIDRTKSNNIIMIAEIENMRTKSFFIKNTKLKSNIYFSTTGLNLYAQKGQKPFFFLIDQSFTAKLVFVPDKKYTTNIEYFLTKTDSIINTKK